MSLQIDSCGCCGICSLWRHEDPATGAVTQTSSTSPVDRQWVLGNWPRYAEVQLLCRSHWIRHWAICHPRSKRILAGSLAYRSSCLSIAYWVLGGCIQLQAGEKWESCVYLLHSWNSQRSPLLLCCFADCLFERSFLCHKVISYFKVKSNPAAQLLKYIFRCGTAMQWIQIQKRTCHLKFVIYNPPEKG